MSEQERPYSNHPAYPILVDAFRKSTRSPEHLAFLALQHLGLNGFCIERENIDDSNDLPHRTQTST